MEVELSHPQSLSILQLEPTLNMLYYVQRADDSWHVAEVIQKREVEVDDEKKKEFYIHYKDCKPPRFRVYYNLLESFPVYDVKAKRLIMKTFWL